MMACFYAIYIVTRCWLQPAIAPPSEIKPIPFSQKTVDSAKYLLPLVLLIFLVLGTVFLGVCTPSEAAAVGALGAFILAAVYRSLNWKATKKSFVSTARITVMVFMIVAGATAFSQILAFSGVAKGIVSLISGLNVTPLLIVVMMQIILLIMGCFMEAFGIMMVAIPIFFPIIKALHLDPVWFGVIFLLNMECGGITPPFGLSLFVMKGVAPSNCSMGDIIKAGMPFLGLNILVMALLIAFPVLTLWLPGLMFKNF
jgi:tripartite ATP-independent transporter DctM subunit